jgi:hypothetical protein
MSRALVLCAAALVSALTTAAVAQHSGTMNPQNHTAMAAGDVRQVVHFPPEMQTNFLGNMREHMQTIDGIIQSLSAGDYAGASRRASERLGLDSPSAAGCKEIEAPGVDASGAATVKNSPPPGSMEEMMALYMPASMRGVGLSMHTAASEFAEVAAKAEATHDTGAAMSALAHVTQNCVACHATYRLR